MKLTGSLLRDARERKNISLNEVSFATKINLKVLQAIEEGDLDHLPPKTFLRGFVKSYADYLRLDVDSVMSQFQEEMGSTKPVVSENQIPREIKTPPIDGSIPPVTLRPPQDPIASEEMGSPTLSLTKILLVVAAVAVIIVGIVAQRMIEKYEREKSNATASVSPTPTVVPTPEVLVEITPTEGASQPAAGAPSNLLSPTMTIAPSGTPVTTPTPKLTVTPTPALTPTPTLTPVKTPTPSPTTVTPTPSQAAALVLTPTPTPTASPTPTPARIPTPSPTRAPIPPANNSGALVTPTPTPSGPPQEVIVEALDSVTINFRIDGGRIQSLNLKPEQIHTFKSRQRVNLEISDGGAVNIIHNGQDRGVPGVLGTPIKLKYP